MKPAGSGPITPDKFWKEEANILDDGEPVISGNGFVLIAVTRVFPKKIDLYAFAAVAAKSSVPENSHV
jgi:hypothetical protein